MEIAYTLVRLEPMAHSADSKYQNMADLYGGPGADRHGHLFKHHNETDAPLIVHDCIFYVTQYTVNETSEMWLPQYTGCRYENNILLWTGGGEYPASLPAEGVTEYNLVNSTQTQIDSIWDTAVHDWKVRHGYAASPVRMPAPAVREQPDAGGTTVWYDLRGVRCRDTGRLSKGIYLKAEGDKLVRTLITR